MHPCSPPLGRDLVERHILVDADVTGQAKHALGNDVAQDLVGAAGDAYRWRTQQHLLELAARFFLRSTGKYAAGVFTGAAEEEAHGQFQQMLLSSPSMRIAGGTDEILRNIIAERVLGLPGDIRVDKDVPFNKIPTKGR